MTVSSRNPTSGYISKENEKRILKSYLHLNVVQIKKMLNMLLYIYRERERQRERALMLGEPEFKPALFSDLGWPF